MRRTCCVCEQDNHDYVDAGNAPMPNVSIIIVNWNTRGLLADCLDSVAQTINDLDVEIIVVDNASSDGSQAMLRQLFPHVHLIANQENVGFARANNQAMTQCAGRYILLLNSDTEVIDGALSNLVAFLDEHSQAGAVGARLLFPDGRTQSSHGAFPNLGDEILSTFGLVSARSTSPEAHRTFDYSEPIETDWLLGACLMVRREVLDAVGLMDEQFFMYSEEIDWCRRIKDRGWKVFYLPIAGVIHHWRGSSKQNRDAMKAELYKSKLKFFHKHSGPWAARALRLAVLSTSFFKMTFCSIMGWFSRGQRAKAKMWWTVISQVASQT